jgi:NitT/TauT family transport system ATP-binding protein
MIDIDKISKSYTDGRGFNKIILKDISLKISNENMAIIAPEGSGKTTLLKIIAGIELPDIGHVHFSSDSKIAFIPEQPSSFPWLNVIENIKYFSSELTNTELENIVSLIGLNGYENHIPHNNSLGFRFRISAARALAVKPNILVLDNPFSKMDGRTKEECYEVVKNISAKNIIIVLATTSISEALILAKNIFLLKKNPAEVVNNYTFVADSEDISKLISSNEFLTLRSTIEGEFKKIESQRFINISI